MSNDIILSAGVRQNLLSLQNTAQLMTTTQNRLATGKKINSALDNPQSFFTSSSLSARAGDLSNLLDSMSTGIQTIQAANNGLTAITSLVQQLQSTASQARSDATASSVTPGTALTLSGSTNSSSATNSKLTFHVPNGISVDVNTDPGAVAATLTGGSAALGAGAGGDIVISSADLASPVTVTLANSDTIAQAVTKINTALSGASNTTITASQDSSSNLVLTDATGNQITVSDAAGNSNLTTAGLGLTSGATSTNGVYAAPLSVDAIVSAINSNANLNTQVKASNSGGKLSLQNLTATAITVDGATSAAVTGKATDTQTLLAGSGGSISTVRQSLMNQFNSLLTQLDKVAGDSGYNGINLLNGDKLTVKFNETGTSSIDVQAKDTSGNAFSINYTNLGLTTQTTTDFSSNSTLDTLSTTLTTALTTLRTQASSLGSQLSVVQTRQDFTKSMINTLQTGADNLVLADTNQEGANMLALQTRQQLSTTALSLSAQAGQAVLQLFQ